jgi:hypothetical protein
MRVLVACESRREQMATLVCLTLLAFTAILIARECNHPELAKSRLLRLKWLCKHSIAFNLIGGFCFVALACFLNVGVA